MYKQNLGSVVSQLLVHELYMDNDGYVGKSPDAIVSATVGSTHLVPS